MTRDDVTIKGYVLRETPSGKAWVFRREDTMTMNEVVFLPKKLVVVTKGTDFEMDQVTLPAWLATERGLT